MLKQIEILLAIGMPLVIGYFTLLWVDQHKERKSNFKNTQNKKERDIITLGHKQLRNLMQMGVNPPVTM